MERTAKSFTPRSMPTILSVTGSDCGSGTSARTETKFARSRFFDGDRCDRTFNFTAFNECN